METSRRSIGHSSSDTAASYSSPTPTSMTTLTSIPCRTCTCSSRAAPSASRSPPPWSGSSPLTPAGAETSEVLATDNPPSRRTKQPQPAALAVAKSSQRRCYACSSRYNSVKTASKVNQC